MARQCLLTHDPSIWRIGAAPSPPDVYWPNVGKLTYIEQAAAKTCVQLAVFAVVITFMVPIIFIQGLTTVSNLVLIFPPLSAVVKEEKIKTIIEGILPSFVLIVFTAILGYFMRILSIQEGIHRSSAIDVAVMRKIFVFSVVNVFFGNIIAGTIITALQDLIEQPEKTIEHIGSAIPGTSRFFMSYILLKSVGGAAAAISSIFACIVYMIMKRAIGNTPRGLADCWKPNAGNMGWMTADILVSALLVTIFTTLQPVMHIIGLIYFIPRFIVSKAQMFYIHEVEFEGYGEMWSVTRGRMGVVLLLYQLTVCVTLGLKLAPVQAALIGAVIMPMTYMYMKLMRVKYQAVVAGIVPLEIYHSDAHRSAASAEKHGILPFLHPALRPDRMEALLSREVTMHGIHPFLEPNLVPLSSEYSQTTHDLERGKLFVLSGDKGRKTPRVAPVSTRAEWDQADGSDLDLGCLKLHVLLRPPQQSEANLHPQPTATRGGGKIPPLQVGGYSYQHKDG